MSINKFDVILVAAIIIVGAFIVDNIPHGRAYEFTSDHCATGELLVRQGGVPCKGLRQDRGWPFVVGSTFTNIKSKDSSYIPSQYSECYSGCHSRYHLSDNLYMLFGMVIVGYGGLKLWASIQLNRQMKNISMR